MTKFWTKKKEERIKKMYKQLSKHPHGLVKIAERLGTTKSAVYKKLGRLGVIVAPWTKRYRSRG